MRGNATGPRMLSSAAGITLNTGRRIQAVHVYDLVNIKVLIEGQVAAIGRVLKAEVALALYIMVHPI